MLVRENDSNFLISPNKKALFWNLIDYYELAWRKEEIFWKLAFILEISRFHTYIIQNFETFRKKKYIGIYFF